MKILCVCLGNICRSPAAEAAIRAAAQREELDIEVDSAGTGSWHIGDPPHPESVAAGHKAGISLTGRARKINSIDFDRFDIILAMDEANRSDLVSMAPTKEAQAKIRLFRTFDPNTNETDIPDPWGGPTEGYEETIRIVMAAADGLIEQIRPQVG